MNENRLAAGELKMSSQLQGRPPSTHRILVVEDDGSIRELNAKVLSRFGYHVDTAVDGAVAWDALQTSQYDLMITDQNMPKMCGVELLKNIRATGMTLPTIMATAALPEREFARNPFLRPDALLLKPYTVDELLGKVQEVLSANREPRAHRVHAVTPLGESSATVKGSVDCPGFDLSLPAAMECEIDARLPNAPSSLLKEPQPVIHQRMHPEICLQSIG